MCYGWREHDPQDQGKEDKCGKWELGGRCTCRVKATQGFASPAKECCLYPKSNGKSLKCFEQVKHIEQVENQYSVAVQKSTLEPGCLARRKADSVTY